MGEAICVCWLGAYSKNSAEKSLRYGKKIWNQIVCYMVQLRPYNQQDIASTTVIFYLMWT